MRRRLIVAAGARRCFALSLVLLLTLLVNSMRADSTPQPLPFTQDWTNGALLAASDLWDGVPGVVGYRGDDLTTSTGTDPRTILVDGTNTPVDISVDQTNPNTFATGGVAEFQIANPVVALNGSATADAPFLLITVNTVGANNIRVSYNVRDLDGSADNAIQPVALHYRIGTTGDFTNVAEAFISDATTGGEATLETPVSVLLPSAADNQAVVQLRIMTTNALGNDEWVGIDDIRVERFTASQGPAVTAATAVPSPVEWGQTLTIAASVTPGINPPSASLVVLADVSAIAGPSMVGLLDDGIAPDQIAGDSVFTGSVVVGAGGVGPRAVPISVTDQLSRTGGGILTVQVVQPVPTVSIAEIQGDSLSSPYATQVVRTRGVVTAVKFNGIFLQSLPGAEDTNPLTSEAVFVFTGGTPPASIQAGDVLDAVGTIIEFVPPQDPFSPSLTEMTGATVVKAGTSSLPAAITLTAADLDPTSGPLLLERFEGMLVFAPSLTAVAPTQGTVNESAATGGTNGLFFAVLTGTPRPFREAGVPLLEPVPPCAAGVDCAIPIFDLNPERLRIDSDAIRGVPPVAVTSGAVLSKATAVVDYGFRTWTLLPTAALTLSDLATGRAARSAANDEFTVASFNMQRFYDTVNDPGVSDVALTPAAFETRLAKASLLLRASLGLPDIVAVQEVENLPTLQTLAARINADAGVQSPGYSAYLLEGNDIGGIDVGFLVSARVTVDRVEQVDAARTWNDPGANHEPRLLNDRPSLALIAGVAAPPPFLPTPIVLVNNHLRSLNGLDSLDGAERSRVRQKRQLQAEGVAAYVQRLQVDDPSVRLVVLGDFNAFAVNDGQVDVLGIVRGVPAPAQQVVAFSPDEVTPDLVDAAEALPATERYSYVFDGNAQALDHILFSAGLSARFRGFDHARVSADFPEAFRGDPTHPLRLSDHDPSIVYFAFAGDNTPPVVTTPGDVQVVAQSPSGAVVEYPSASALDAVDGAVAATCDPRSGATFGFGVTLVTCRAVDRAGNQGLGTFTVTILDATTHGLMVGVGAIGVGFGTTTIVATALERASGQTAAVFVGGREASGAPGTFLATRIDAVGFFDASASPESAAIDTVRVVGAGVWNGSGGYTFELVVVDRGEPGRTRDSASIVVRAPGGPVVFERLGNLTHGNIDVLAVP